MQEQRTDDKAEGPTHYVCTESNKYGFVRLELRKVSSPSLA